ncbi:hypothetical protein C8R41DRAFT_920809 [Lentinula lateritia]|uniref:Clr5 domain-containing protein n=1 Tax=Lentinula lateritia TaxID=40482 RepID=A0ABQ8VDC2_9AGAR|nr:hypothetical protein C8R41DRAFT_920809 [Lentinula lateritia]
MTDSEESESEVTSHLLDDFGNASNQFLESDSAPVASGSHHVPNTTSNNRTGKNQHRESARIGDKKVYTALLEYHRRNITNKDTISQLLKTDYGINLSASSVTQHKRHRGIKGSRATTQSIGNLLCCK